MYVIVDCAKMSVVHNDSSCKRILSVSCGLSFPPIRPVFFFFSNFNGTYEFSSVVE